LGKAAEEERLVMRSKPIRRRDFLKTSGMAALAFSSPTWGSPVVQTKTGASRAQGRTTVAEDIGRWVADLRYEDLPPETIHKAKRVLLDTLACALGAFDAPPVRMAQRVAALQGGNLQATIIGAGSKVSCEQAAFLNGMALRYLDYNDYAALGSPHHCSINVAPALAIAEMKKLTGKDLLLGIIAGYEVQLRLREATEGGSAGQGWDQGTVATAYASAAVAAKLLGLDASKIGYAIAIAAAHGNTLAEVRGAAVSSGGVMTPSKGTADPMSARLGTFAALLAEQGLTYPLTILEGTAGYGKVVAGKLQDEILRQRSGEFQISKSCFKIWPCFAYGQSPIAAALEIHRQKPVPEEIRSITAGVSADAYKNQQDYVGEITAREHADHSIPYVIVRGLLDGQVTVDDFEERRFKESRAVDLLQKVILRSDPSLSGAGREAYGIKLEVQLRNGSILKSELAAPPGSMQNPADDGILTKKFFALSEKVLGKTRAEKAAQTILLVDQVSDLQQLLSAVAPGGKNALL
jgi:2-methylcitrate dehydratase